ncbi:MAG: hypothetical protein J2O39_09155, partial [Acidimicrobiales bacterium]|nr:hypothetical protein [Acidimicrobiales bacterium]
QHALSGCSLEGGPGGDWDEPPDPGTAGFHLQRTDRDPATSAGRDESGRLHLRLQEAPSARPAPGSAG